MVDEGLLELLREAAAAVARRLGDHGEWGPSGLRRGQYRSDLAADEAALAVLLGAGLGVLSEESGHHEGSLDLLAVLDPLDGSTNAYRGIPWFATSICVLDEAGPLAAVVWNQASGRRYEASRGGGARREGQPIASSGEVHLASSIVALAGFPRAPLGWEQFRSLGAAALDLCLVAEGTLDAWFDCSADGHGPWDYLGGQLICTEAGAVVRERAGRELVVREHAARRAPLGAATPELAAALLAADAQRGTSPSVGA